MNNFYDSLERSLKTEVKIPPGLLLSASEFYAKAHLESYESSLPVKLNELVSDVIQLSPDCDGGEGGVACQVGYVRLFSNGFALISKTSRNVFDENRIKIAKRIKTLDDSSLSQTDPTSFQLGEKNVAEPVVWNSSHFYFF